MRYADLLKWVYSHQAQIDSEALAGDTLAIHVKKANALHNRLNTEVTETALRKAVGRYREGKKNE